MKSKKKLWIRFVIIMAFAVLFLLFALFAGKFAPYGSVGNTLYRPSESAMQTVSHGN